jgi:Domain of Unknown Function (DUF1206).
MTAVGTARRGARRTADSGLLVGLTRMGFIGYGLLHLAIAWLAVQIALGNTATSGDQSGALGTLVAQPFGRFLLWLIVVGLCAMAIWQLLLAAVGHRDEHGKSRVMQRLGSAAKMLVYAAVAFTAFKVVTGAGASSGDQQQNATAGIMAKPAGQFLVGLAGLVVVAVGVGLVFYGAKRKFEDKLLIGRMSQRVRQLACRLGQFGYVAKGVAFTIVGVLLLDAAITHNPAKSRGLDAALRALAHQPFGVFLLIAVGIGFAAFGVYCFIQSRYRKVGS